MKVLDMRDREDGVTKPLRRKKFVNKQVQGMLIARCVGYAVACVCFVLVGATLWRTWQAPQTLVFEHFVAVVQQYTGLLTGLACLMPFILFDMLRTSHRIAGPLVRLRREMSRLADGEPVQPLAFRNEDYWHELADEFNRIAELQRTTDVQPSPRTSQVAEQPMTV